MRPTPDALPVLPAVDPSVSLAWCSHTSLDLPGSCRAQGRGEPFASSKCLPSKKSRTSTLTGARPGDPNPLAGEWGSARFHRCSRTSTRPFSAPLFAVASRPHALPRLLQRMFQRARQRTARTSQRTESVMLGRLPDRSIVTFRSKGNHRGYAGSGAEDHRTSTFPFEIAPKRDFAPTPIASGSSCREDRSTTLSGTTRIKNDLANAALLARRRAARGPWDA